MLSKLSWGQYFTIIICAVALYYIVILLLFYRSEIQAILTRRAIAQNPEEKKLPSDHTTEQAEVFSGLEDVVADIGSILERAGNGASKAVLLMQIGNRLASYAGLRHPAFQAAINNYIVKQAKEKCGAVFSIEELREAWKN